MAHDSIAYGVDWYHGSICSNTPPDDSTPTDPPVSESGSEYVVPSGLVASCSFYDHQLHLWHIDFLPTNS